MRARRARLIGGGWLAAAAGFCGLACALTYAIGQEWLDKDWWGWLRYPLGFAAVIALLVGMLHLAPRLTAHLLAQILVLRAAWANKQLPDVKELEDRIRAAFQPPEDPGSKVEEYRDVVGADAPPPSADEWNNVVRPVLPRPPSTPPRRTTSTPTSR
jgi:hypothetical protein